MRYEIKAISAAGEIVALHIDAANESLARELADKDGYAVLSASARWSALSLLPARKSRFAVLLFSVELLSLLDAGLALIEALQALAARTAGGESRRVLDGVIATLNEGVPFSQAAGRFPEHFSALYVATIRSSERTGGLKEALGRYVAYEEELDRVRKKLVAAAIYPSILMAVGGLVLLFLLFYVVPRFARVYDDLSTTLPFFSSLLLAVGRWVQAYGSLLLIALAGAAAFSIYLLADPARRARLNALLWRVPKLGERMKTFQLARLYRTLGMLLRAGIPVVSAMGMVGGLLAEHLRIQLAQATRRIEEGQPLSAVLPAAGLATAVAERMLLVGERSGRMAEMMDRIARFSDEENARYLDAFMRAFEPLLMAALGLAVGTVVVLMYMPVFELAGSLG